MFLQVVIWVSVGTAAFAFCGVTPEWEKALAEKNEAHRRLQPSAAFSRSDKLGPFRMHAHYGDLSILSTEQVSRLQTVTVPSLISWYAHVLSVYNLDQNWVLVQDSCAGQTVPETHQTSGLPNVDLVLYISATTDNTGSWIARAGPCAFDGGDSAGSPIAGTFEINAAQFTTSLEVQDEIHVARHEVAHILAFHTYLFFHFVQADGTFYSEPVIEGWARGTEVLELATPSVVEKARAAFDCEDMKGVELETWGGSGTAYSHWEKRIMMNDFMVGDLIKDPVYSDITLALFEDSGWYSVNYDYTDQITFAKGSGCRFLNTPCLVSGVAQFPEFCDAPSTELCSNLHTKKGLCRIGTYTSTLPTPYRYFTSPYDGGLDQLADFCPYPMPYSNGDCTRRSKVMPGIEPFYFGEKACEDCRCFTGTYIVTGVGLTGDPNHSGCHEVICEQGVATVVIGTSRVKCPVEGGKATGIEGYTGYITCPPYEEICGPIYCPNGCFGYGMCVNGECICEDGYSGLDCSIICNSSCRTCSGPEPTDCLSCYSFAGLDSDNSCQCSEGYDLDSGTRKCTPICHPTCTTCSKPTANACLSCEEKAALDTFGACRCNAGFARSTELAKCMQCDSTCQTCSGPLQTQCLTCPDHSTKSSAGECVCDKGYTPSEEKAGCQQCHSTCLSCSGLLPTQCLSCLLHSELSSSGACNCVAGYTRSDSECLPCDSSCVSCQGTTAQDCTACKLHASLSSGTLVGSCQCDQGYYEEINCEACAVSCKTCSGSKPTQCTSCYSGFLASTGECVCGPHLFMSSTGVCAPCSPDCASCETTASQCTACDEAVSKLEDKKCVCLVSAFPDPATGLCIACHPACASCIGPEASQCLTCKASGTVVVEGNCQCVGSNYLANAQSECLPCDSACQTCSGPLQTQCLTCPEHSTKSSAGKCVCDEGYAYSEGCRPCHSTCLLCSGVLLTQCLSCPIHSELSLSGVCECAVGYTRSDSGCLPCDSSCVSCQGTTAQDCTTCKLHASLSSETLVGSCQCDQGYYEEINCEACAASCKTCSGSKPTQCTSCYSGIPASTGECLCGPHFFMSSTGVCTPCSPDCASCETTASQCTACDEVVSRLQDKKCVCLVSAFPDPATGLCIACHPACASCIGPEASQCLTCKASGTVVVEGNCQCVGSNYLANAQSECLPCDSACQTCSRGGVEDCLSCYDQGALSPPAGPGTCSCARSLFYSPPTGCLPCHSSCKECTGELASQCLMCYSEATLLEGVCACASDSTLDLSKGSCVKCSANCKSCDNDSSYCTDCDSIVSFLTDTNTCECLQGAFQAETGKCEACDEACLTCSAASSSSCLSCFPHASLLSGTCECDTGFFPDSSVRNCFPCHKTCEMCNGAGAEACVYCAFPAILSNHSCICPDGFYRADAGCKQCHNTCKTCSSPSETACLSCFRQAELAEAAPSSCVCVEGTVPMPMADNCGVVNCDVTCQSCVSDGPRDCSSCYPNAEAQGSFPTACLCEAGYFPSPNAANCAPCHSSCQSCTKSFYSCDSCASNLFLIDGIYCGNECPTGQIATSRICQAPASSLVFLFQLKSSNTPLLDTISQFRIQSDSKPVAYYQQGWLFNGLSDFFQLPPSRIEPSRNIVLGASHSMQFWVRSSTSGCLVTKYKVTSEEIRVLLRLCILETAELRLDFAAASLGDASAMSTQTLIGGVVPETWTAVGYQMVFQGKSATEVTLHIGQKAVATDVYPSFIFKDHIGDADSVEFYIGAALNPSHSLSSFFQGNMAEISIYNSPMPVSDSVACSCSTCTTTGTCISLCLPSQYQTSTGCAPCDASCSQGCFRDTDCRANKDPLCAVFEDFESCVACGGLAERGTSGCQCLANASPQPSSGNCVCNAGFQQAGEICVRCYPYFSPDEVSAYFDSSYLSVIVIFARPALTSALPVCTQLFLPITLSKLGNSPICSWDTSSQIASVQLGTDSTLVKEQLALNYLQLYSSQGACSYAATPLLPIVMYRYPLPQVLVSLRTPETYSLACSSSPSLNLDASGTIGGKGRNLLFSWVITSEPLQIALAPYQTLTTTQPILSLPNTVLDTSKLTVDLSVTNFLGTKNSTSAVIVVTQAAAISLEVDGGSYITTSVSVKTSIKVTPIDICSTTGALQYTWTFLQSTPTDNRDLSSFLSSPSPPNTMSIPENTLQPGYTYTFQVKVYNSINSGSTSFTVYVSKSPLIVSLDRTDSDISSTNRYTISGAKSYDPDSSPGTLMYAWSCMEGNTPCVDTSGQLVVNQVSSAVLTLEPNLLRVGANWNITLTISKDIRSLSRSVLVAIKAKTAADFTQAVPVPLRVNPQEALRIVLQVTADQSTTFQWSQTNGNSLASLTPLTYPYLVIAADSMQNGVVYSFTLTANNANGASSAHISFTANSPPRSGSVAITPASGVALGTQFQQVNSGWEDPENDYPLAYYLTYTYQGFQAAVGRKQLGTSRVFKAGPGHFSFTVHIFDSMETYTSLALPSVSVSLPQRLLQTASVLTSFQADIINTDRTFEMIRAYSSVYQFDNSTYAGVFSALQGYLALLTDLESTDIDSCIGSLEALFWQKSQMNDRNLAQILSFMEGVVKRYKGTLSNYQLAYLMAVLSGYPGKTNEELYQMQTFMQKLQGISSALAMPGQSPYILTSTTATVYTRRMSISGLSSLRTTTGNTTVTFPRDIGNLLGLAEDLVVDIRVTTQTLTDATSEQVGISLYTAGRFSGFSYLPDSSLALLPVQNLSSPINLTLSVQSMEPNVSYECVYQDSNNQWVSDGLSLLSLSSTKATCQTSHLTSFQVARKPIVLPTSLPTPVISSAPGTDCGRNFAPVAIVAAVVLFGALACGAFLCVDMRKKEQKEAPNSNHPMREAESAVDENQMVQIVINEHSENPKASPQKAEPSFCHLFSESHCLLGLFFYSPELQRGVKIALWTASLAGGMAFIGAVYEWQGEGDDSSIADVWTEYTYRDFLYSLCGVGVGLAIESVLMVCVSIAGRVQRGKIAAAVLACVLEGIVLGVALGGTIYMTVDLCYREGGKWAVSFLPLFLGQLAVSQSVVALARALYLLVSH